MNKSLITALLLCLGNISFAWEITYFATDDHPYLQGEYLQEPPNIVFIIADDLSWKHLGAYGSEELLTPNIDRLAREGVTFENAFVSTPSCSPSRAAILTGRNGFELEEGASLWGYLPAKFPTYTSLLEDKDYEIASTGKAWGPGLLIDRKLNPAGKPYLNIRTNKYASSFDQSPVSDIHYSENLSIFLKQIDQDQAFCFWLGTFEPHRGYKKGLAAVQKLDCTRIKVPEFLPNEDQVRSDICEYLAEIQHIDQTIGEVINVLQEQKRIDNTILIITSDNGMPFPRAKANLYDYGTRVPLIVWWPNQIKGGRRVTDIISLTDIAPTLLEISGTPIPAEMSGKSFLPQLISKQSGQIDPKRNTAYTYRERHAFSYSNGGSIPARAIRTNEYLLIQNFNTDSLTRDIDGGPTKDFMVKNKIKYADLFQLSFDKRQAFELYDISKDKFQLNNLIQDPNYQKVFEELRNQLHTYLISRKDPRLMAEPQPFLYNPYFGFLFSKGLIKWAPDQQGQDLSFTERRNLLKKAFLMVNEEDWYKEMIKKQNGKL